MAYQINQIVNVTDNNGITTTGTVFALSTSGVWVNCDDDKQTYFVPFNQVTPMINPTFPDVTFFDGYCPIAAQKLMKTTMNYTF